MIRIKNSIIVLITLMLCFVSVAEAQNQDVGSFSGGFQSSTNFFIRDSLIGAANIPQYDNELIGTQAWLDLGYTQHGFEIGLRFDMFNNSNLLNPNASYTAQGIGRWHIGKKTDKLDIRVGHIYDQIGAGIIYRAYEERPLLIDNALYGARLIYDLNENWAVKGFAGRQRFLFSTYEPTIRGATLEGYVNLTKEEEGATLFTLAPGVGVLNRALDRAAVDAIGSAIRGYIPEEQFKLKTNTFATTLFNTLSYGPISLYTEAAFKSSEAFFNPETLLTQPVGPPTEGRWVRQRGTVFYSSLSYAGNGLGVTLEAKRTENFDFRADPQLSLLQGLVSFLPPMNRANIYRLTARYSPATQFLSEQAYQVDVRYRFSKKISAIVNYSNINTLEGEKLYREIFTEIYYKHSKKLKVKGGLQLLEYNQDVYEVKPGVPNVETVVPYVDLLYKFTRKKSLRFEMQYMFTGDDDKAGFKQDYGDWFFFLAEYAMAPHWSFAISDMYNSSAGKNTPIGEDGTKQLLHYPRVDIYYTQKANRFSLSYIKQVEGIVCNGGVCRLEPAFSGFNFSVNSSF